MPINDDFDRALVQTLPDAVFITQDGRAVFANKAGLDLFGAKSLSELAAHACADLVDPALRDMVIERMRQLIEERRRVPLVTQRWRRLDGGWFEVEVAASPIMHRGRPAILSVMRDLTARRESELALRQSELRYRSLVETAGCMIVCLTPDHRITEWNHEAERLSGWRRDEVLGRDYFELFLPDDARDAVAADFEKVVGGVETREFENVFLSRDGQRHVLLWNVTQLVDGNGRMYGILSVGRDITARKAFEDQLQRSRELLQRQTTLLEETQSAASVGGWELDLTTGALHWTDEMYRICERSPMEFAPAVDTAMAHCVPESRATLNSAMQRLTEAGEPFDLEVELITGRNRRIWVRAIGKCERVGNRIVRLYGAMQDLTERKKAEDAIKRYGENQRLMLSELDHRVRNNLAALAALIDLSARTAPDLAALAHSVRSRVMAMTAVHVLLSRGHWFAVDFRSLIDALVPHDLRSAVEAVGPDVLVGPRQVTALGMVLQELVANSIKYGSLHCPGSKVHLEWAIEPHTDDELLMRLTWRECGGPPVASSQTPGLGTGLIMGFVKTEMRGEAELTYPAEGALLKFVFRLDRLQDDCSSRVAEGTQPHMLASR